VAVAGLGGNGCVLGPPGTIGTTDCPVVAPPADLPNDGDPWPEALLDTGDAIASPADEVMLLLMPPPPPPLKEDESTPEEEVLVGIKLILLGLNVS